MRLSLLNKHLAVLLSEHYSVRDMDRMNAIHKAITFHETIGDLNE